MCGAVARTRGAGAVTPAPFGVRGSGDADGDRASQFQHTVEDMDGHIYFGRPASVRTRAQAVTDHLLDLNLPMAASARARFVYPEAFCQLARPCSAMN